MAPSAIIAEVPVSEHTVSQGVRGIPARAPVARRSVAKRDLAANRSFLNEALLENQRIKSSSKMLDILVALVVHAVVVATPILAGLYFTDAINVKDFSATLLVAPSPPSPPPPAQASAAVKSQAPKRVFTNGGKLHAPTYIPQRVAEIKEAPLEADATKLAALSKWKYEPTYLNDQPIPVQMIVTVHFRTGNG
jgi:hypothetical protein